MSKKYLTPEEIGELDKDVLNDLIRRGVNIRPVARESTPLPRNILAYIGEAFLQGGDGRMVGAPAPASYAPPGSGSDGHRGEIPVIVLCRPADTVAPGTKRPTPKQAVMVLEKGTHRLLGERRGHVRGSRYATNLFLARGLGATSFDLIYPEPGQTPGRPLKSGERRKMWSQRLPVSAIQQIAALAQALELSQSDVVALAVEKLAVVLARGVDGRSGT